VLICDGYEWLLGDCVGGVCGVVWWGVGIIVTESFKSV